MRRAPPSPGGATRRPRGTARFVTRRSAAGLTLAVAALLAPLAAARAAPFIWDEDTDRIDDRIETVHVLGYRFAFDQGDTLMRQRIGLVRGPAGIVYFVYVVYERPPDAGDVAALSAIGMPTLHRYEAVPAVRSIATYPQVEAAASLPGVERVEAVPVLHPLVREAAAAIGARDRSGQVCPTWEAAGGADGAGVVVAFLDTGINDAPEATYPGHEALAGRCLGGAVFVAGDSALDTPRDGSVNPADRGGPLTLAHGTHVASLAVGSGGTSGHALGIAPGARFVDVKVIGETGVGTGLAEALDWCIHNRDRDWGGPPGYEGIDVINASLSSLDRTDGNDLASRLVNRAVERGIVVVASMGNDGLDGHVPSPAGADRALAVGAFDHQRSPRAGDDRYAAFTNRGPRADDGDADAADERKPDLLAPGVALLGADGDLATDGAQYRRMSGTSMAAAMASGAVAALRSAYPGLEPAAIAELLRATASRLLDGAPEGAGGADPRWSPAIGFGAIDLHAARLEREQPDRSQIARFELAGAADRLRASLRTQRELGAAHFAIERAPEVDGTPGVFAPLDSAAATGSPSLAGADNRAEYRWEWVVPERERGAPFWYRVSYTERGRRFDTPPRRFESPTGPSVATLEVTIVHNAYDHDVSARIAVGGSVPPVGLPGHGASAPALVLPLPASSGAVANDWVDGSSATGNVAWTFHVGVPRGEAERYLPPGPDHPWRLEVAEGGYVNRSGRIAGYRLTWHPDGGGDVVFEGGPVPQPTVEGRTVTAAVPAVPLGVDPPPRAAGPRFGPNPVRSGRTVTFIAPQGAAGDVRIFDVAGREVGRAAWRAADDVRRARWEARDAAGDPLPSGVYFARLGERAAARVVVLRP